MLQIYLSFKDPQVRIFELTLDKIHEENPFMISVLGALTQNLTISVKMILFPMKAS